LGLSHDNSELRKKKGRNSTVDENFDTDEGKNGIRRPSKIPKKKKKSINQNRGRETSPAAENENDDSLPRKMKKKKSKNDDDMDKSDDNDDDPNSNNDVAAPKKKRASKKKRPSRGLMDEHSEENTVSDSRSSINSSTRSSNKYDGRRVSSSSSRSSNRYDDRRVSNSSTRSSKRYHGGRESNVSTRSSTTSNDGRRSQHRSSGMSRRSHNMHSHMEYDDDDYMSDLGSEMDMDVLDDDYSEGYDVGVDDEQENRFKYSTEDLPDGGCRNSRCCLIAAGIFFLIIGIIGGVVMSKMANSGDRRFLRSI